ncbi:MAG: hypothetical protein ACJ8R9_24405 [Steroidobacteraceae bacterium]
MSSIDNAKTGYEAVAPIGNAAVQSLPKSNPLKIVSFPEIPKVYGYGLNAVQLGIKCGEGAQKDGLSGCMTEAGKEALLTTAQTIGTEAGTCLAAETGPLAPAIGVATGVCARAATEYAIDHPAVLQGLTHAFDCDPVGNCTDRSLQTAQDTRDDANPTRLDLESQFAQTSSQNDAAAQAAQQAAAAEAAQSSNSNTESGFADFMAGLSQSLSVAAILQQSSQSSAGPVPVSPVLLPEPFSEPIQSAPAIPAGWVPCSCPNQHSSTGQYFGATLYHPPGPKCR